MGRMMEREEAGYDEDFYSEFKVEPKKADNTMLIIGGICVAGVLLYVYK